MLILCSNYLGAWRKNFTDQKYLVFKTTACTLSYHSQIDHITSCIKLNSSKSKRASLRPKLTKAIQSTTLKPSIARLWITTQIKKKLWTWTILDPLKLYLPLITLALLLRVRPPEVKEAHLEIIDSVRSAKFSPQLSCLLHKPGTLNNCKPTNLQLSGSIRRAVRYTMSPRSPIKPLQSVAEAEKQARSISQKRHIRSWLRIITTQRAILPPPRIYSNKRWMTCGRGNQPCINNSVSEFPPFLSQNFQHFYFATILHRAEIYFLNWSSDCR